MQSPVARRACERWNPQGQTAVVVGARVPQELAQVRRIVGDMPLLVPGIGAQGGDSDATVQAGRRADGRGMMVSSSRAILYAGEGNDFADAARQAALQTRDALRAAVRHSSGAASGG